MPKLADWLIELQVVGYDQATQLLDDVTRKLTDQERAGKQAVDRLRAKFESGFSKIQAAVLAAQASITAFVAAGMQGTVQAENMSNAFWRLSASISRIFTPVVTALTKAINGVAHAFEGLSEKQMDTLMTFGMWTVGVMGAIKVLNQFGVKLDDVAASLSLLLGMKVGVGGMLTALAGLAVIGYQLHSFFNAKDPSSHQHDPREKVELDPELKGLPDNQKLAVLNRRSGELNKLEQQILDRQSNPGPPRSRDPLNFSRKVEGGGDHGRPQSGTKQINEWLLGKIGIEPRGMTKEEAAVDAGLNNVEQWFHTIMFKWGKAFGNKDLNKMIDATDPRNPNSDAERLATIRDKMARTQKQRTEVLDKMGGKSDHDQMLSGGNFSRPEDVWRRIQSAALRGTPTDHMQSVAENTTKILGLLTGAVNNNTSMRSVRDAAAREGNAPEPSDLTSD